MHKPGGAPLAPELMKKGIAVARERAPTLLKALRAPSS